MKKFFTMLALLVCTFATTTVMAGPRGCPGRPCGPGGWGPGCRPCPPPPCRPCGPGWGGCGWGWNCDRGLGNAAAITSIVANGISILGNLSYPRTTVVTQPVVTQPVVTQPVYTAPVVQPTYVAPAPVYTPAPVVVQPGGPLPPGMIVGGGIEYCW